MSREEIKINLWKTETPSRGGLRDMGPRPAVLRTAQTRTGRRALVVMKARRPAHGPALSGEVVPGFASRATSMNPDSTLLLFPRIQMSPMLTSSGSLWSAR